MFRIAMLLVLSAAVAVGCDPRPKETDATPLDEARSPAFEVYDSGGVVIVVNHAPERDRADFWSLDPEPVFVLGQRWDFAGTGRAGDASNETDGAIFSVRALARLVDGRIAVLSEENRQIYLLEPSGKLSKAIGRRGRGPGEFVRPKHMWYAPPDTLIVWDEWFGPVTRFDTAGTVLERRSIDLGLALERLPDQASVESPIFPLPDGSFVVKVDLRNRPLERPPDNTFVRYPAVEYVRLDARYDTVSLGIWEGREQWVVPESLGKASAAVKIALEPDYLHGTFLNSLFLAVGRPVSMFVAPGATNEIRQFSLEGTLVRIIRRTTPRVSVTERAHRAWRENELRVLGVINDWDWYSPLVNAMPRWESYPPIHGMVMDAEGRLWVREWSERETGVPDQWSVFGPDGRWLGVLDDPPSPTGMPDLGRCFLCSIEGDLFLRVRMDDLGVERVEAYRIRRNG